jgi:hypothetical protein
MPAVVAAAAVVVVAVAVAVVREPEVGEQAVVVRELAQPAQELAVVAAAERVLVQEQELVREPAAVVVAVAVMVGEILMPAHTARHTRTDQAKGAIRLGLVAVAVIACVMPVVTVGLTATG